MTTTPGLWRSTFQDNLTTPLDQIDGVVAPTTSDTFFAVWFDSGNFNGGRSAVVVRSFDSLGNPTSGDIPNVLNNAFGVPFNVNTDVPPGAVRLPIAGASDGVAVAFADNFGGGADRDVYVERFNVALGNLDPAGFILVDGSSLVTDHPSITSFSTSGVGSLLVAYTNQVSLGHSNIVVRSISSAGAVSAPITILDDGLANDNSALATLANGT